MLRLKAVVGRWYQGADGQIFEVVAVDEDAATVEIQYLEGEIGEFELDIWRMLTLVRVPPPDDWEAASGDLESDTLSLVDEALWQSSFTSLSYED